MQVAFKRTRDALYWGAILGEPLAMSMFMMRPILTSEFGATPRQLAFLVTLKHAVTLLSVYGSLWALNKRERLIPQLMWTGVVLRLPMLFFGFLSNAWMALAAIGVHMLIGKAGNPAWFEVLRLNLPKKEDRTRIYSISSAVSVIEGLALGLLLKEVFKKDTASWRWIIPLTSAIGLCSLWWTWRIPVPEGEHAPQKRQEAPRATDHNPLEFFARPWITAWKLLIERFDLQVFHLGYFLCGGGILLFHPLLTKFCIEGLHLSHPSEHVDIFMIYPSLGYAISMYGWNRSLRSGLFSASGKLSLAFALHILLLIVACLSHGHHLFQKDAQKFLLCAAQVMYGIGMGGSHVLWNMSGTIFCREGEDSSVYTTTNMVVLGVRALTVPFLGAWLGDQIGHLNTLYICGICCLLGTGILWGYGSEERKRSKVLAKK